MLNPRKRSKRRRGVILSSKGWRRLLVAQQQSELVHNGGHPYTAETLNELTQLSPNTLAKVRSCKTPVDRQTLETYFNAFGLILTPGDYILPSSDADASDILAEQTHHPRASSSQLDWGEAIDVSVFHGRTEELATLERWILSDRSRLVGVLGMGGIGKTALSVKLAQQVTRRRRKGKRERRKGIGNGDRLSESEFEYVIWRSLRNAPPLETLLGELIPFLSAGRESQVEIRFLLQCLRNARCLVILDNLETILLSGEYAGQYRAGYENYGELLQLIGESAHSSCLLFTSREKPAEMATLEGIELSVHALQLQGSPEAAQRLIQAKGLSGSEAQQQQLCDRYGCNPLALKIVATSIQDLFGGDIAVFLAEDIVIFNSIQRLLEQQFNRLSSLELTVIYWLAINRDWTAISELTEDIFPGVSKANLLEALESLSRRSLIEKQAGSYTQQPVVMEYVIECLIEQVCQEITAKRSNLSLFCSHALLKTTVKDYVRESQIRLILEPIASQLRSTFQTSKALEEKFQAILSQPRNESTPLSGYGGGNLINLCRYLQFDLTGYDFSRLTIWQADLQKINLHRVNFAHANFAKSIFTQTFGGIISVAFSPNGELLAGGDTNGRIRLWRVADGQTLLSYQGHNQWVFSLAWSPDGQILVSGSADRTVRLWDPNSGQCLKTLQGHTARIWSVAWSPDGKTLASGSADQTVRLWDSSSGQCLKTLQGHTGWIWSVAWSPDGKTLASSSADQTVRLWSSKRGQCLKTLQGHTSYVCSGGLESRWKNPR